MFSVLAILTCILGCLIHGKVSANLYQWVHFVSGVSSERMDSRFSAEKVKGHPDVVPRYGDISGSWACAQNTSHEGLTIYFPEEVFKPRLFIHETYNTGHVKSISALDEFGEWRSVWNRSAISNGYQYARIFAPPLLDPGSAVKAMNITVDCSSGKPVAIDSVIMTGIPKPFKTRYE